MSAVTGFLYRDGRPAEPRVLAAMLGVLRHRGPEGAGSWLQGPVALGHRRLGTEAEGEGTPCVLGDLVVTADARLDNRRELAALLSVRAGGCTDSELILRAYRQWGERCPEKLRGDFAFVLWEGRRRTLFCARDRFGVKPLYYFDGADVFAFASEIKALLRVPSTPCRPCERAIGDYLAGLDREDCGTFYEEVCRLPPAHALRLGPEGKRLFRYWSLDLSRELPGRARGEHCEAFRHTFFAAVRRRIEGAQPTGVLLSGGLDSSAVTCAARTLLDGRKLTALSAVFDEAPECDERAWAAAVSARGGVEPCRVHADGPDALADLDHMLWHQEEPFCDPSFFIHWALCAAARRRGIRVLLDGYHGDSTVSHGFGHLAEIAHREQWDLFASEAMAVSGRTGLPAARLFRRYGVPVLAEMAGAAPPAQLIRQAERAFRLFGLSPWSFVVRRLAERAMPGALVRALRAHGVRTSEEPPLLVRPAFLRRSGLAVRLRERAAASRRPVRSARDEHHRLLSAGGGALFLEAIDKSCGAFSLAAVHPFLDSDLVELCLALPGDLKLCAGRSRAVLREALCDILPPAIRSRGSKTSLLPAFGRVFVRWLSALSPETRAQMLERVAEYVDPAELRRILARTGAGNPTAELLVAWRALSLALWLRQRALEEPAGNPRALSLSSMPADDNPRRLERRQL
jgi:asparagine synthase (glutamine-hydrolysing)